MEPPDANLITLPPPSRPKFAPARPPSPTLPTDLQQGAVNGPVGCELIVRNIPPQPGLKITDIVQNTIMDILHRNAFPDLYDLEVFANATRTESLNTFCYLRLAHNIASLDSNPRPDLLANWITPLSNEKPEWTVGWSPQKIGRDKKMWVRAAGMPLVKDPKAQVAALVEQLTKKGIITVGSWPMDSGAAGLILQYEKDTSRLEELAPLSIPNFPNPITISRSFKQIEPIYAFELVITGIGDFDQSFTTTLDNFFFHRYKTENTSLWVSSRTPERDVYCFLMADWTATKKVLDDSECFRNIITTKNPGVFPPRLLWQVNTESTWTRSSGSSIRNAGDTMQRELQAIQNRLDIIERDNKAQFNAVDQRLTLFQQSLVTVTNTIQQLSDGVQSTQLAIMAQQRVTQSRDRLSAIHRKIDLLDRQIADEPSQHKADLMRERRTGLYEEAEALSDRIEEGDRAVSITIAPPPPLPLNANTSTSVSRPSTPPLSRLPATPSPSPKKRSLPKPSQAPQKRGRLNGADNDQASGSSKPHEDEASSSENDVAMLVCELSHLTVDSLSNPETGDTLGNTRRSLIPNLKDLSRNCKLPTHSYPFHSLRNPFLFTLSFKYFFSIMICLHFSMSVLAMPYNPPSSLSIYSLNANGLGHALKLHHINSVIRTRNPHIFVFAESKSKTKVSDKLPTSSYTIFEEDAQPTENHHLFKWGIVLGIRKDVQIAQRLIINDAALRGRVIALDLALPTDTGTAFYHRIIAAYAPWNPGGNPLTMSFWSSLAQLTVDAKHGWTIVGDLNATLTQSERSSGGADARSHYRNFLRNVDGQDVWLTVPDRTVLNDWTCRAKDAESGGSIIDRIIVSRHGVLQAEIFVAKRPSDYVPVTDHRAIIGRIFPIPPHGAFGTNMAHPTLPDPRIRYPKSTEKELFQKYQEQTDARAQILGLFDKVISDDTAFLAQYEALTTVIVKTAEDCFGTWRHPFNSILNDLSSPKIQSIKAEIKHIGASIWLDRNPVSARVSDSSRRYYERAKSKHERLRNSSIDFSQSLRLMRKKLCKDLYQERSKEAFERTKRADIRKISNAIQSGTTKKLVTSANTFMGSPLMVTDPNNEESLLSEPHQVKRAMATYFSRLYDRSTPPTASKPWLNTPSVRKVKDKIRSNPFQWPCVATLSDFRAMLRKGSSRPSPGPDKWEKWCVKSLSDRTLSLVLDLHNYIVSNSRFPGNVKDVTLVTIHKRGLQTNLLNYRGIMLSNFLANSPASWLNYLLTPYAAKNGLIPDTQVATQQGVQTRDLMSYLSSLTCWANRHKQTVYSIKRDQLKGFDYLSPDGLHDAIRAYGLPHQIIDLDIAAQENVKCSIRTAFGLTDPIIINGVTKQGGPLSSLKSTLTTSLGHRWLDDLALESPETLYVQSEMGKKNDPHLDIDTLRLPVTMVEATDDSYIFAKSLVGLQYFCLEMERFQFAYGWLTQWTKTFVYILQPSGDVPQSVVMPSITRKPGSNSRNITYHPVPVKLGHLEMLRTEVDNPTLRYNELHDFIANFSIPKFSIRPPLTLLRKIVMQNIASKVRAILSLQPIKTKDARKLDHEIALKVHDLLGFPFRPTTDIMTLPISLFGFEFPSVERINMAAAIEGLARDLNHHVEAYRQMARLSLSDWTCSINGCIDPLDGAGLSRNFNRYYGRIPTTWIVAQQALRSLQPQLHLRQTDKSYLMQGKTSILHALKSTNNQRLQLPHGRVWISLRSKGIQWLYQVGKWSFSHTKGYVFTVDATPPFNPHLSGNAAALHSWNLMANLLDGLPIKWVHTSSWDLLWDRDIRRQAAEYRIRLDATMSRHEPTIVSNSGITTSFWASDGSMRPASAGPTEHKTLTSAITGPMTLVYRLTGRAFSILHAELMGIITGLVLSSTMSDSPSTLYTDHLNSVRLIQDARTRLSGSMEWRLRYTTARSFYRWILHLDHAQHHRNTIEYTPGHADEVSTPAHLNNMADLYASSSQDNLNGLPIAPIPTFFMDDYTYFSERDGWIETGIKDYVSLIDAQEKAQILGSGHSYRMATWLYDERPPPIFQYTRTVSAYSVAIQLYARSGQLATRYGLRQKTKTIQDRCRFGCNAIEDPHHLFVHCYRYNGMRTETLQEAIRGTEHILDRQKLSFDSNALISLKEMIQNLFSDHPVWPLGKSQFYLGHVPKLEHRLPRELFDSFVTYQRMLRNLHSFLHITQIRLTGRIYGDFQRRAAQITIY